MAAAAAGGGAVAQAAGSDLWAWFRTRCARLIGRGDPRRESDALDQLDRTAADLRDADESERERVRNNHARLWEEEFASLLGSMQQQPEESERLTAALHALARDFDDSRGSSGGVLSGNTFNGPTAFTTGDHSTQNVRFGREG
ncbi:hypothetical protein ACFWYX_28260 [[Kitasatospora] papulosa]|uniref:hypothetical protein n=1 Tax=[Kitasatospora] papulosa TaxID=1464011 RepID=UPI0036B8EB4C